MLTEKNAQRPPWLRRLKMLWAGREHEEAFESLSWKVVIKIIIIPPRENLGLYSSLFLCKNMESSLSHYLQNSSVCSDWPAVCTGGACSSHCGLEVVF